MKGKIFHNTEQDSYILSLGFFSWAAQAAKLDRVTRAGTVSRLNGVSFTHAKHMPQNISEPHALPNALGCRTKIEGHSRTVRGQTGANFIFWFERLR